VCLSANLQTSFNWPSMNMQLYLYSQLYLKFLHHLQCRRLFLLPDVHLQRCPLQHQLGRLWPAGRPPAPSPPYERPPSLPVSAAAGVLNELIMRRVPDAPLRPPPVEPCRHCPGAQTGSIMSQDRHDMPNKVLASPAHTTGTVPLLSHQVTNHLYVSCWQATWSRQCQAGCYVTGPIPQQG